jgi:hypothetical protein
MLYALGALHPLAPQPELKGHTVKISHQAPAPAKAITVAEATPGQTVAIGADIYIVTSQTRPGGTTRNFLVNLATGTQLWPTGPVLMPVDAVVHVHPQPAAHVADRQAQLDRMELSRRVCEIADRLEQAIAKIRYAPGVESTLAKVVLQEAEEQVRGLLR